MKSSKYAKEFRDSTVQLVINSNEPANKIAKDIGVNEKTLYNWIREYKQKSNCSIDLAEKTITLKDGNSIGKSNLKESLEEENRRLRAENKILTQERDILKKATAYFAKGVL